MTKKTRFFNVLQLYIQLQLLAIAIIFFALNQLTALKTGWIIVAMFINKTIYSLRKKEPSQ